MAWWHGAGYAWISWANGFYYGTSWATARKCMSWNQDRSFVLLGLAHRSPNDDDEKPKLDEVGDFLRFAP
eukprot:3541671-Prymnesium_polylepis.1